MAIPPIPSSGGFDPLHGFDLATIDHWTDYYRSRLARSLEQIRGARPGTNRGEAVLDAAVRLVEELLGQISVSLNSKHSLLREELRLKDISVTALEKQLNACNIQILEFNRTKKAGFIRAALKGLGAVALAIGGPIVGAVATHELEANPSAMSIDVSGPSSLRELALACEILDLAIDESGGYSESESTDQTQLDLDDIDAGAESEADAADEWPTDLDWFDIQDNEGGFELGGDISAVEGAIWRSKGFSPTAAYDWHMAGMDPDAAAAWSGMGFEPFEADAWRRQSFEPEEAAAWNAEDMSPGAARDFSLVGFEPEEARQWHAAEIDPFDAKNWQYHGFDADDAEHYGALGYDPATAADVRDADDAEDE